MVDISCIFATVTTFYTKSQARPNELFIIRLKCKWYLILALHFYFLSRVVKSSGMQYSSGMQSNHKSEQADLHQG